MRDPARIDRILEKVRSVWKRWPDFRISQLFVCVTTPGEHPNTATAYDPFYLEDDRFEAALDGWLNKMPKDPA